MTRHQLKMVHADIRAFQMIDTVFTGKPLRFCDLTGEIVGFLPLTSDNRQLSEVIRVRIQLAQTGLKG